MVSIVYQSVDGPFQLPPCLAHLLLQRYLCSRCAFTAVDSFHNLGYMHSYIFCDAFHFSLCISKLSVSFVVLSLLGNFAIKAGFKVR